MKLFIYNFFYRIGLLNLIDVFLSKFLNAAHDVHLFNTKKKLIKKGAYIGKNSGIDASVRFRIHENSRLVVGDNVRILNDAWLITEKGDELIIGDNTFISQNVVISGNIRIGENVLIGGYVSIIDANHNYSDVNKNINEQGGNKKNIIIGNDVWIGTHSVILQGVKIGDHSIIGANSTVTHNVEEFSVSAGSPAREVKKR